MNIMYLVTELLVLFLLSTEGWAKDRNITHNRAKKCFGLDGCGYTVPDGDIILEYGQPLAITCNLYKSVAKKWSSQNEAPPSTRLYFVRNERKILPNNEYDPNNKTAEKVVIVNETSIRLTIERPEKTVRDNFFCYFNQSNEPRGQLTACNNIVVVGVPPKNVTDFSCVSENYEMLVCTWTAPENFARTQYELAFQVPPLNHQFFPCPEYPQFDDNRQMNCSWTIFTDPQYRQSKSTYKFFLRMNNSLGNLTQEFDFDHYKRMRPKHVENLVAIATSPHTISLRWDYNSIIKGFPRPLVGQILYTCEYCGNSWHLGGQFISPDEARVTSYELKDLEYPHTLYDIRVIIKPDEADDSMWSNYSTINRRTESERPRCPPQLTQGSYEIVNKVKPRDSRDVFVYFQQVKESDKNGQNFTYEVEIFPHQPVVELTKAYAKFVDLEYKEYMVRFWSKNELGRSSLSSRVAIPAQTLKEPEQFLKIERSPGHYELEWEKPKTNLPITNYTLFWCNERERPHLCTGYLNWTIVSNDTFRYNITLTNHTTYQFAIAANNEDSSSGMRWAECTAVPNRTVGKIRNVWVSRVGSDFIELTWKLECSDILSNVIGYVVYYCKTSSLTSVGCDEKMKEVYFKGDLSVQSATVTNLTPYTTYRLALSVKNTQGLSQPSEYLGNVTLESAPTPPLNITVTEVTNSSISIEWKPPRKENGTIKKYFIRITDCVTSNHTDEKVVDAKKTKETIRNLESYNKYSINMLACTVECSNSSEEITVVTKMGVPGKIDKLFEVNSNDTITIIGWSKPGKPRGELEHYQLTSTHDDTNLDGGDLVTIPNTEQSYTIESCQKAGNYHSFFVAVKAVNKINGTLFPGPWSDTLKIYCFRSSWYHVFYVALAIAVFLVCVYAGRKVYKCVKIARDVQVKLPAGLAPAVEHSEKSSDIDIHRTFSHDPDEELLLERMTDKCQIGDSSGCSSGQESITSSVESTHLSMDSGTDQPKNVADDNKENSLRLRNVSAKGYVMHDPTPVVNRAAKPAPTPPGNYCLIGVDPSTKPNQDTPYVTINDALPPYVAGDQSPVILPPYEPFKTPNPGYVPFSPKEPASKNTGYVLAGDLNIIAAPTSEAKPDYIVDTAQMGLKAPATVWQQPIVEPSTKPGYVSVGDAPPPVKEVKGYVPHRQFESKALKED